ncbi:MAG: glucoamylase family protein, partial [Bacteroidota bacterium]
MRRPLWILTLLCLFTGNSALGQPAIDSILDSLQHTAFNFFWNEANPGNGLIRDRAPVLGSSPSGIPCSIASVGFGLSAICIGVDHGWVTRADAASRVLITLKTFWNGPQGSGDGYIGNFGLFYHFLDMTTAKRTWSSELSTIDTGLLLAGIIDAQQFFETGDPAEVSIRAYADSIYRRMNWDLMRNSHNGIFFGWMPVTGFQTYGEWTGYCEAMIMYILAMGSPTYPVDSLGWVKWVQGYQWQNQYGYQYVIFPPLFGHQYSHCWIDFRGIQDAFMRDHGIDYFENSRRATLAQRAYCAANPGGFAGYSDSLWGITACDDPDVGYQAHGAPPAQSDNGTLAPTAPIGSIAFAPDAVIPCIRNLYTNYQTQMWTRYGFRDAFNISKNWWDTDVIGIDEGPIIMMIENYRTGRVWNRFMKNPDVQRGLQVAGFVQTPSAVEPMPSQPTEFALSQNYPNPFNPKTVISCSVPPSAERDLVSNGVRDGQLTVDSRMKLAVYDLLGREVAVLANGRYPAG